MNIVNFTTEEALALIASGDHTRVQQIFISKDGEVRIGDPSGTSPRDLAGWLYARSWTFSATNSGEQGYVGPAAASDQEWMSEVLAGLRDAQGSFARGEQPQFDFWI